MENNPASLTRPLGITGHNRVGTLAFADALAAGRLTRSHCEESHGHRTPEEPQV